MSGTPHREAGMRQPDEYPSRVGGEPGLLDRNDPVDYTDDPEVSPLRRSHVDDYKRDGFVTIDRLFDASEIHVITDELVRLRAERGRQDDESVIMEPKSTVVRSIFEVHKTSPVFARLVRDSRLVDVAQYLLGDEVYVHQSRLNYKPGFVGREFYWHSDFETWHIEDGMPRMRALSVSLGLTENVDVNGPLMLVPGSHLKYVSCGGETPEEHYRQSLRQQEYGVPPKELLGKLIEWGGIDAITGPPGSATFFDCNTMHGSNSNITPFPRANVFIVYNSISNRLQEPYGGKTPRPGFLAERSEYTPLKSISGRLRPGLGR
ncbi:MAG: ectoine hydroxylase [Woeseiaceae bacterium]